MDSQTVAASIEAGFAEYVTRQSRANAKQNNLWASQFTQCLRESYYQVAHGDQRTAWDPETLWRFRRGQDRERDLLADLARIGRNCQPPFDLIGQQERFELKDRDGRVVLSGKVDARVRVDGIAMPLECKSWHPNLTERLKCFEHLFQNHWTERGAYQLLMYLLGSGQQYGLMLLDRPGIPRILAVDLEEHLDRAEQFLAGATLIMEHVDLGEPPPFTLDSDLCRRCSWYGHLCQPPLMSDAATILQDPELEAMLDRREELEGSAAEWEDLDGLVKARLRGIEQGVAGHWHIQGRWSKSVSFEIPRDVKDQYRHENPQGQFRLKIMRIS